MAALVPKKFENLDWVKTIQNRKKKALAKARNIADAYNSPMTHAKRGAIVLVGSTAAGYIDRKAEGIELLGRTFQPSVLLGVASFTGAILTGREELMDGATGMFAPHAYQIGYDWAAPAEES